MSKRQQTRSLSSDGRHRKQTAADGVAVSVDDQHSPFGAPAAPVYTAHDGRPGRRLMPVGSLDGLARLLEEGEDLVRHAQAAESGSASSGSDPTGSLLHQSRRLAVRGNADSTSTTAWSAGGSGTPTARAVGRVAAVQPFAGAKVCRLHPSAASQPAALRRTQAGLETAAGLQAFHEVSHHAPGGPRRAAEPGGRRLVGESLAE